MVTQITAYECNVCGYSSRQLEEVEEHAAGLPTKRDFRYQVGDQKWVDDGSFLRSHAIQPKQALPYAEVKITARFVNRRHRNVYEIKFLTPMGAAVFYKGDKTIADEESILPEEPEPFQLLTKSGKPVAIEDYEDYMSGKKR